MSETVTLEIPDELAQRARALAAATHRRFEDAVVDWLRRALDEPPVESLPDETLLTLCDATLGEADHEALTTLLNGHREGSLSDEDKGRLERFTRALRTP